MSKQTFKYLNKRKKSTNAISKFFITLSLLLCMSMVPIRTNSSTTNISHSTILQDQRQKLIEIEQLNKEINKKDSIKTELIKEIDKYIKTNFPKSKLSGSQVALTCLNKQMDPIFVLAQGQIESGFGTAGTAAKTNSVWNVGAFDGHSASQQIANGYHFRHPNHSIEPYIDLLQSKYLVNGKTVHHLMNNFVNVNGHRYASSQTYETKLKKTYYAIKHSTQIHTLFSQLS